jgi:hypothetical protein
LATEPIQIDAELLERARRLAKERHCSIDEIIREALNKIERPSQQPRPLIGLFADDPSLADKVLDDVYRTREQGTLRQPNHG